jgi:UDP-N-acetylglucosamine--N-acetylmuramyl-(pentapeptide) pyrophosphoryl-undecaprenol N-acetylglucosamine transferase
MTSNELRIPNAEKGLFLSSSGGHFAELLYIASVFNASPDSSMITFSGFDTRNTQPQFKIHYFDYIPPRKILPLLKLLPKVAKIYKIGRYDFLASTGAGIALIGFLVSKIYRKPFFYVESFARQSSLSLTAKILASLGLRRIFVQSSELISENRYFLAPPLSNFVSRSGPSKFDDRSLTIFVAFGTLQGYEFLRAVEIVNQVVRDSDKVFWQTGFTFSTEINGEVLAYVERADFLSYIQESDIVITHAGIGIIGDCLNLGKMPIVIPRRSIFQEHVDDHQVEIVRLLEGRKLVLNLEKEVSRDILLKAMNTKIIRGQ